MIELINQSGAGSRGRGAFSAVREALNQAENRLFTEFLLSRDRVEYGRIAGFVANGGVLG